MELMVVIAIIGILSAISIPAFMGWRPNYRLKSAVMDMQTNLQLTRVEAIRQNQNCQVLFAGNQYTIPCLNNMTGKIVNLADYNGQISFGGAPATITFTSRGLCNTVGFTMNDPGASVSYAFQTSTSGGISVQIQ